MLNYGLILLNSGLFGGFLREGDVDEYHWLDGAL
jgi:hypothetical protein